MADGRRDDEKMEANEHLQEDELVRTIEYFYTSWHLIRKESDKIEKILGYLKTYLFLLNGSFVDSARRTVKLFGLTTGGNSSNVHTRLHGMLQYLHTCVLELDMDDQHRVDVENIQKAVDIGYEIAIGMRHQHSIVSGSDRAMLPDYTGSQFHDTIALEELKPNQRLLLQYTDRIKAMNLRKKGTGLYRPMFTDRGFSTHCFEYWCEIEEFIFNQSMPRTEIWTSLTSSTGNTAMCVNYLKSCTEEHIPQLRKNQSLFAFENGIYDCNTDTFYEFGVDSFATEDGSCCAVFHNFPFSVYNGDDPMEIKTDVVDKILSEQMPDCMVREVFYAFLGRMFFPAGTHDKWQIWMNLKGVGGSGKSTLLEIISNIYEDRDVGTLESKSPETFTFEHLIGCFMFVVHDIGKDCNLSPTQLFTMISNERCTVARKHRTAISIYWNVQGIMGGNDYPNWVDDGGSASRRLLNFKFPNMVVRSDPTLFAKAKAQIPALVQKSVKAYFKLLKKSKQNGEQMDVWNTGFLPPYFHETRKDMANALNPIAEFVSNPDFCEHDPSASTSMQDFRKHYKNFLQENAIRLDNRSKLKPDAYTPVFHIYKMRKVQNQIHGIRLVNFM